MENLKAVIEAWINDKIQRVKPYAIPAAFVAGFLAHWIIF
jgi:hypothetical protein